jgi:L,D-transpeptidase ErfK/SrfK
MRIQNQKVFLVVLALVAVLASAVQSVSFAQEDEEFTATVKRYPYRIPDLTVIGSPTWVKVLQRKDTLLDIARRNGLGFNEIGLLYPHTDAWVPPGGKRIMVPTFWVLPTTQFQQLVINVAELRLYYFDKKTSTVQTYPLGIGDEGFETPLGTWTVTDKRVNPTWYIPASIRPEYGGETMIPPGPDNPLGDYIMKFSAGAYGIHGTNKPWGVGRLVSHGCIRLYPEHIKILFPQVPVGTKLEIIYEPVKLGQRDGQVFVEAHPDVYKKVPDYTRYALDKLEKSPLVSMVDRNRYLEAVELQNGVPTNVTRLSNPNISSKTIEFMK